jgi:rare lipoprotein A
MKRMSAILLIFAAAFCVPRYTEAQSTDLFRQEGIASWYGPEFDGRPPASGEIFNSSLLTAAHPTLPFGTMLTVTNRHNNKQVTVRVNDRGPFVSARIIDVSKAAAEQLDMLVTGTAPVIIESDRITAPAPGRTAAADLYWTVPPSGSPAAPSSDAPPVSAPAQYPVYTPPIVKPVPAPAPPVQEVPQPVPLPPPSAPAPAPGRLTLTPAITPAPDKTYRLQVGSYKIPRNAYDAYIKLKNTGLNPAYEQSGEYYRVVLAGIQGTDVQAVAEKLGAAGFKEALIREER